jgi:hypothetical protein
MSRVSCVFICMYYKIEILQTSSHSWVVHVVTTTTKIRLVFTLKGI